MSETAPHHYCANHAGLPTSRTCADCGRPFCESCLTEMSGQPLCGWCRDQRLRRIQQRSTVNPATVVLMARIFNGVALLLGLGISVLYGAMFALPAFSPIPNGPAGTGGNSGAQSVSMVFVSIAAIVAVISLLIYLPPLFGLGPRRGWLWTWQMVILVISVIGGCLSLGSVGTLLLVPAVALLVFWVKPEVRDYCGAQG